MVDITFSIREGYDAAAAFEHQRTAPARGKAARGGDPVAVEQAAQHGELPLVRCEDQGAGGILQAAHVPREGPEGIRVHDSRHARGGQRTLHELRDPRAPAEARAYGQAAHAFQPRLDLGQGLGGEAALRVAGQRKGHGLVVLHGGDGIDALRHAEPDKARAAAHRRARGEARRARVAAAAGQYEQAAVVPLGALPRPLGQADGAVWFFSLGFHGITLYIFQIHKSIYLTSGERCAINVFQLKIFYCCERENDPKRRTENGGRRL